MGDRFVMKVGDFIVIDSGTLWNYDRSSHGGFRRVIRGASAIVLSTELDSPTGGVTMKVLLSDGRVGWLLANCYELVEVDP